MVLKYPEKQPDNGIYAVLKIVNSVSRDKVNTSGLTEQL